MGLPRSNLVKSKSTPLPTPAPEPSGVRALEVATTYPQIGNPFLAAPAQSGSVDVPVDMASDPFATTHADAPAADHGPSTHDLLERAARLGPPRPTMESIVLPNDPVLLSKMQPEAAQRRARFRKIVKATLGACVALCVAAIAASALSPSEASAASAAEAGARTAPSRPVVTIEKLDDMTRGKAVTSRAVTAKAVRATKGKRR